MLYWLLPIAAYLLGSLSFAWFAGKANGIDLRQHGSKNLGATNAGRVLGKKWFVLVFTADVLKGLFPVLMAVHLPAALQHPVPAAAWLGIATGAGAVLGHIYTCWHGFKGGKAVATSLGVLIALLPLVAACCLGVWLIAWLIGWLGCKATRSNAVGPASVVVSLAAPGIHYALSADPLGVDAPRTGFITVLAILVIIKHRSNIRKLFGAEPTSSPLPAPRSPLQDSQSP